MDFRIFLLAIKTRANYALFTAASCVFCLLTGCATGPNANPTDPLEPLNRTVSRFNEGIDKAIIKPVASTYRDVTPLLVRQGVSNFFDNLEDAWSFVNGVLQLRPRVAADNFMRFAVNTFFGLGGILDIAGEMGIERHSEDLGKTLGRWGVPAGPYVVLPLLGPTTLRDSFTIGIESNIEPVRQINHVQTRNSLYALRIVDTRSGFLRLGNMLDEAALDKYTFTRDAFLQKRRAEIYRPGNSNQDPDAEPDSAKDANKVDDKDNGPNADAGQDKTKPKVP